MPVALKTAVVCDQEFASPDGAIRAIAGSVECHAQDRSGVGRPVVVSHAARHVCMMVLYIEHGEMFRLCPLLAVARGQTVRVQIAGDDRGFYPKQGLVARHGLFEAFKGFPVLHVPDMLADKGMLVTGQTEGVLQLGAAGQDAPQGKRRPNG